MALLNLLLIPILAALGLFDTDGGGGSTGAADGASGGGSPTHTGSGGSSSGGTAGGGNQQPGGAAASGSGSTGSAASGGAATGSAGASAAGGQAPPPQQGTSLEDVAKLQRELNEARAQAGQYRAAGIQAIAQALGIELPKAKGEEGQEAQFAALQQEITALRTESRENALSAALERVFTKLGAKPTLARPYIAGQLKDLDPKADDFSTKLEQIVQAAIDEEPALKATQAAPRSGGEFNGGNETNPDLASMSVEDLRKKRAEWRGDSTTTH